MALHEPCDSIDNHADHVTSIEYVAVVSIRSTMTELVSLARASVQACGKDVPHSPNAPWFLVAAWVYAPIVHQGYPRGCRAGVGDGVKSDTRDAPLTPR